MNLLTFKRQDVEKILIQARMSELADTESIWLVKDHGIYIMPRSARSGGAKVFVAYAVECNPDQMPFDDWYSAAVRIMGGDDSADTLPCKLFETALKRSGDVRLRITPEMISIA